MIGAPIRTVIADDEPVARRGLRRLLASDVDLEIVGEARNGTEVVDTVPRLNAELLFLDVEMPEKDGLESLLELGAARPIVVFVTAFEQYALRAFEAEALDYLLKPFSDDRLARVVARAKEQVRHRRMGALDVRVVDDDSRFATRLAIRRRDGVEIIQVADIDWIEAIGYQVRIHSGAQTHVLREPLHELEARLDPARFLRVHRSYIVRIDRIRGIQRYFRGAFVVVLTDGRRLMLSRRRRALVEGALSLWGRQSGG